MKMRSFLTCGLTALLLTFVTPAGAAPTLDAGDHELAFNTSGQLVELFVTGGDLVDGLDLILEVGDGTEGPLITSVDLKTGTIFASAEYIETAVVPPPGRLTRTTVDGVTDVAATGKVANVTFDTTGIEPGDYPFELVAVIPEVDTFSTTFLRNGAPVETTLVSGTLTVLPEPSALGFLGIAGLLLARRPRRR